MNTARAQAVQPKAMRDYLLMLRRRRGLAFGISIVAVLVTVVASLLWPAVYRSSATILIEQQEIPQDLVRSTVSSYADERIQVINQRVMTRANLADIIQKYDLYADQRRTDPMEVVIGEMRNDIKLNTVSAGVLDPRSGRPMQTTIAFTLAYESRSPQLAQKVANELTSLYLNENLATRRQMATQTSAFLTEEVERTSAEISTLERQLAEFKQQNIASMPELAQFNMQIADRTGQELLALEQNLRAARERKIYLEAQLAQVNPRGSLFAESGERILGPVDRLKSLRAQYVGISAVYAADHPDLVRMRKEIASLEEEVGKSGGSSVRELDASLADARGELAESRKRYGNDHPTVQRLERQVAALEQALSGQQPAARTAVTAEADNPAYIQLQAQLQAATAEINSIEKKRGELQVKLNGLERRIALSPTVEQQYRELSRDYENAWARYKDLKVKQTEAKLAESLETERKGERFTLIEPPELPERPDRPNRLLILFVGLVLAAVAGIGGALMVEAVNGTVRGSDDIDMVFSTPPLAAIPYIVTAEERRWRVFARAGVATGLVLCAILVAALVHSTVMPLEVAWFVALRHLGL